MKWHNFSLLFLNKVITLLYTNDYGFREALRSDPGQTCFINYQDWITWDAKFRKLNMKCNCRCRWNVHLFCEPQPLFAMIFVIISGKYTEIISYVHMYATIAFTSCTEPHPLIDFCCRIPRVLPLQYSKEYYYAKHVEQTYSLHKATSAFMGHVPVSASLQIWLTTLTDPSRYLFV